MKTKAAVAWQAGKPLTIETLDLQGPKFGMTHFINPKEVEAGSQFGALCFSKVTDLPCCRV
jgi:Zn-dependent alcohol dehydrogenase